jgi:hypothetical protein
MGLIRGKGLPQKKVKTIKKGNTHRIKKPSQVETGFIVELEPSCRQTEYKLSGATTWLNYLLYFQL